MKPPVVHETEVERAARLERKARTDNILVELSPEKRARWETVSQMLSWFFAMLGHMDSAPGIDPAKEVIQGLRVDRDERIIWLARVKQMMAKTAIQQGSQRGLKLLWLHFRAPTPIGHRVDSDGRKTMVYGNHSVPIRELHEHDGESISRDVTISDYWRTVDLVEDLACNSGWVAARMERQRRVSKVESYRRNG